jgi:hypothetical protein
MMPRKNHALDVGLVQTENPLCAHPGRPTEFYHGTSLEAILGIQANGFLVGLSGSNAGQALATRDIPGYVTRGTQYDTWSTYQGIILSLLGVDVVGR